MSQITLPPKCPNCSLPKGHTGPCKQINRAKSKCESKVLGKPNYLSGSRPAYDNKRAAYTRESYEQAKRRVNRLILDATKQGVEEAIRQFEAEG